MVSPEPWAGFARKAADAVRTPGPPAGWAAPEPLARSAVLPEPSPGPTFPAQFPSTQTRGSQPVDSSPSGMFSVLPSTHPDQGLAPKLPLLELSLTARTKAAASLIPPPLVTPGRPEKARRAAWAASRARNRADVPRGAAGAEGRECEGRHGVCRETGVGGHRADGRTLGSRPRFRPSEAQQVIHGWPGFH